MRPPRPASWLAPPRRSCAQPQPLQGKLMAPWVEIDPDEAAPVLSRGDPGGPASRARIENCPARTAPQPDATPCDLERPHCRMADSPPVGGGEEREKKERRKQKRENFFF